MSLGGSPITGRHDEAAEPGRARRGWDLDVGDTDGLLEDVTVKQVFAFLLTFLVRCRLFLLVFSVVIITVLVLSVTDPFGGGGGRVVGAEGERILFVGELLGQVPGVRPDGEVGVGGGGGGETGRGRIPGVVMGTVRRTMRRMMRRKRPERDGVGGGGGGRRS